MDYKLPQLKGSEKQIKWANDILNQLMIYVDNIESQNVQSGSIREDSHISERIDAIKAFREEYIIGQVFKSFEEMPYGSAARVIEIRNTLTNRTYVWRDFRHYTIGKIGKEKWDSLRFRFQ